MRRRFLSSLLIVLSVVLGMSEKAGEDEPAGSVSSITLHDDESVKPKTAKTKSLLHCRLDASSSSSIRTHGRSKTSLSHSRSSGLVGKLQVALHLRRIASYVQSDDLDSVPPQVYRELVDMHQSRYRDAYSGYARRKAWKILLSLIDTPHEISLVKALLSFPVHTICSFLSSVADTSPPDAGYDVHPLCTIYKSIQRQDRPAVDE